MQADSANVLKAAQNPMHLSYVCGRMLTYADVC
jgi:hypothetical protein